MRIETKNGIDYRKNTFGQMSGHETEKKVYYGTVAELMGMDKSVLTERNGNTERLFPEWDKDSKYVCVCNGKAIYYSDKMDESDLFIIE